MSGSDVYNERLRQSPAPAHRITADSDGRIYFDNSPITLAVFNGYSIRIGCTDVELKAIQHIYTALKTMGHIR